MGTVACCSTVIMRLLLVIGLAATSFGKNVVVEWKAGSKLADLCIAPGDSVTFLWQGSHHNVEKVTKEGFDNCTGFTSTAGKAGPDTKTLEKTGIHYFACGVGNHCANQQKLKVKVNRHCGRE